MDKKVEIEFYEDEKGICDLMNLMSPKDQSRFVKKKEK